jgi:hypothetical protein
MKKFDMTTKTFALAISALVLGATGCGSGGGTSGGPTTATSPSAAGLAPIHGKYAPKIDPANFVAVVDNPYFPLKPETAFHFEGVLGKTPQVDDAVVTARKVEILGVKCTAVRDTVSEHGRPIERTFDFYAQDKQGNVWYMGEDSFELKNGTFAKASDSWRGGVDGAKPGIIMLAHPRAGDSYRQEYYPAGEALDEGRVLGYSPSVKVPYGRFTHVLVTSDFSPLEPQTEHKFYAAGIGEISEKVVKGHHEAFQLVSVRH